MTLHIPVTALRSAFLRNALSPLSRRWRNARPTREPREYEFLVDSFYRHGRRDGWLEYLDFAQLYFLTDDGNAVIDLIDPVYNATVNVAMPQHISGVGFQGDGATAALNTGWLPRVDDYHLALYSVSPATETGIDVAAGPSSGDLLAIKVATTGGRTRFYATNSVGILVPASAAHGWRSLDRNGTTVRTDVNGTITSRDQAAGTVNGGLPGSPLYVFRVSPGGVRADGILAFVAGGRSMPVDLAEHFRGDVLTILKAANVYDPEMFDTVDPQGQNHFRHTDIFGINLPAGMEVVQHFRAPTHDGESRSTYAYYPHSHVNVPPASLIALSNSTYTGPCRARIWEHRSDLALEATGRSRIPNPVNPVMFVGGRQARTSYTTYERSIGAQTVIIMKFLGYAARDDMDSGIGGYLDVAESYGYTEDDVYEWDYVTANAADIFTEEFGVWQCATNKIILLPVTLADIPQCIGIDHDCERKDWCPPELANGARHLWAHLCAIKGQRYNIYTNPLYNAFNNGMDITNIHLLLADPNIERITTLVLQRTAFGPVAEQIAKQKALCRGPNGDVPIPAGKLEMVVGIGPPHFSFDYDDAEYVNEVLRTDPDYSALTIFRDLGIPGGPIDRSYNQVLARLVGLPTTAPELPPDLPEWVPVFNGQAATHYVYAPSGHFWYAGAAYDTLQDLLAAMGFVFTRNGLGWYWSRGKGSEDGGVLLQYAANEPRWAYDASGNLRGIRMAPNRSQVVRFSRTLTDALWVKTNCTAHQDQIGLDGEPNTATRLVATANDATILQSLTFASAARTQTVWAKRGAGSGAIYQTMDGDANRTELVGLDGTFRRFSIGPTTLANPVVGLKMATAGDEIIIGNIQNTVSAFPTDPIINDSNITAARQMEDLSALVAELAGFFQGAGAAAIFVEADSVDTGRVLLSFDDGTTNNRLRFDIGQSGASNARFQVQTGGVQQAAITVANFPGIGLLHKQGGSWQKDLFRGVSNGLQGTDDTLGDVPNVTRMHFFREGAGTATAGAQGTLLGWALFEAPVSGAALVSLTS